MKIWRYSTTLFFVVWWIMYFMGLATAVHETEVFSDVILAYVLLFGAGVGITTLLYLAGKDNNEVS